MKLEIHPLCELFPVMDAEELRELADDIQENGQVEPIVTLNGQILDGRNRFLACKLAGIEPKTIEFDFAAVNRTPEEYVWSMNVERRHLKADQKRQLIARLLKADPARSNRQIAEQTKSSPTTVGKTREELEARGDVSTMDTRKDARGRQHPARKPKAKPKAKPETTEKILMLTSTLDELNGLWLKGSGPDNAYVYTVQVEEWLYTVKRVKPLVDAKAETGRAVRERQGAQ